jgi:NAD-dependent dihydropyrimidine dehydrogenase PreA subunit
MKRLKSLLINLLQTLLRLLPFPCKTGVVTIGNPGRDAPVLLTCNFRLTVERVRGALAGIDAYLLIANSRGVNVWCAATGGLLTNHDVVSVLKTSGIEGLVDHRRVILPQLAATGIEGRVIREKTSWTVVWGPVDATAIPRFLSNGMEKSVEMRTVGFPWPERLEMAVAWAFPISLISVLFFQILREGVLPLVGFIWGWAVLIFLSFPLYQRRLSTTGRNAGFILFDFGQRCFPLLLWGFGILVFAGCTLLTGAFSWAFFFRCAVASFVVVLILGLDLMGSTPVYKSGLHEDRLLRIELDAQRCKGVGICEQVCPTNVIEMDNHQRVASLPRAEQCVQCGACIVQCPFDALHFRSPTGDVVPPETIRIFKLNLLGERKNRVRTGATAK